MDEFMQVGKITNVQGLMGEVRVDAWADSPDFFKQFKTLYIGHDHMPLTVIGARSHKKMAILKFEGITDINSAMTIRGQVVYFKRSDANLPDGHFFIADLLGLEAIDCETGEILGKIDEVLPLPAHNVYAIRGGARDFLLPAVPEFIKETNIAQSYVKVYMMEGL